MPPTSKVVSPAEAARVLEATDLKRDIDPRTLAWRLTMAARGYWLWAGLKRPGGQVQALAAKMLATASDLLELLEAEEVEAVIPPPPPADVLAGRWLVTRLTDVLEELAEQAQGGGIQVGASASGGHPRLDHGTRRRNGACGLDPAGAVQRAVRSRQEGRGPRWRSRPLHHQRRERDGVCGRTPDAVRKAISRWNTFRRQQHALQGGQSRG